MNTTNKAIFLSKKIYKRICKCISISTQLDLSAAFRKSNENIDNFIKALYAGNNYNFDTIDNTRENLKIYHKAIDTFNEYRYKCF